MKESSWLRPEGVVTLNTIVSEVEKVKKFITVTVGNISPTHYSLYVTDVSHP
jgi:hypothetical protein